MTDAPFSQESEEACIGAVLTAPLYYLNIAAFLKPADFFFLRHNYIWQAMGNLEARHDPIDMVTVSEELQAMGILAEVGGPAYLTQLISNVPTSIHAEVYGALVYRCAQRRQLIKSCDEIKVLAVDESMTVEKVFELAESKLLSVTVSEKSQGDTDIKSAVHSYMDDAEKLRELREQGIMPGLPTGYPSVDDIISGAYRGETIVTAGPAKSGKSSFRLNVVRNQAKVGARIVIFITEMSKSAIIRKFVSMESGLSVDTLKNAKFTPQEWSWFVEASNRVSNWNVHIIDDYKGLTPLDVRRVLRRIMHNESVDGVLIDGLWMMRSNRPSEKRHTAVADIMKDLAEIATNFNIPIDLVHQCSRAANTRRDPRPIIGDLGESIGVEQNAYTIIFLYRESYYKKDSTEATEIIVAANRDGNVGTANLGFDKQSETYCELKEISTRQPIVKVVDDDRKDLYH